MKRRLPPLNALVVAESVARLRSFKAAGEELGVTPSAVSHQVRMLESWLGTSLFDRATRSVKLTEVGERYLKRVSLVFDDLAALTRQEAVRNAKQTVLRVQTTDSLASRWLVSRLPDFVQKRPDISVQVSTFDFKEGFKASEMDVAILYGRGDWANCVARQILRETIFPVCSSSLCPSSDLEDQRALLRYPLIHDTNLGVTWHRWWMAMFQVAEKHCPAELSAGLRFSHSHLALQAAERGNGIALASRPLVLEALASDTLVGAPHLQIATGHGYYIVHTASAEAEKRCAPFSNWLLSQKDVD